MSIIKTPFQINFEELFLCETASDLMSCGEFYILLERFCNHIRKSDSQYDEFLNYYFNDEGYLDIWRIPHLIIDTFNQNLKAHEVLGFKEFRNTFLKFLAEFYNFCLSECKFGLYVKSDLSSLNILHQLRIRQKFLETLMVTFINVMDNIENFQQGDMRICA